jgi:rSAM/selenodomain-associated transferase 1
MRLLLVFLSEPLPGQVKSRLTHAIGPERAEVVYRAMVRILLAQLSGLEQCRIRFCHTPDDAGDALRLWLLTEVMEVPEIQLAPEIMDFHPQGEGDLEDRICRAAGNAFEEGYQKVAIMSSDCIELSSRWIHAAFAQLNEQHEVVAGPTTTGGHHLLAMQRYLPALLRQVSWSGTNAFQSTIQNAIQEGITLYQLPPLPEIGTENDYHQALSGPMGRRLRKAIETFDP